MNALLIEDNPGDAVLIGQKLDEGREFALETVTTLAEALERIERDETPDLALLDLSLPDSRGLETFRVLHAAAPDLPVVVMSGSDDEELAIRTVQEGAQDYLCKGDLDVRLLVRSMRYAVERARVRRALAQERSYLTTLMEGLPDSIYFKDDHHRFVLVNRALSKVLGLADPKDAAGHTDQEYFSPEHAHSAWVDETEVMRTGQPVIGKVEQEVSRTGIRRWVLTNKLPLRNAKGEIVGTFGVSSDISELKRIEDALRSSEERYRRLLNSVTDYIYTVYLEDGRPVATSHSEGCVAVTGYSREEYFSDKGLWLKMVHPDDRAAVIENFERMCRGASADAIEHRIIQKSGAIRWVRNTPTAHYDSLGRLGSYDSVVADITERKEAELKLRAANLRLKELLEQLTRSHEALKSAQLELIQAEKMQSIGRLAAGIAHEVKNPLAILQLGLNYLEKLPADTSPPKPVLEQMTDAVQRANTVITGLLGYAAAKNLEMTECDVQKVIKQALHYVKHLLIEGHVTVVLEIGQHVPRLWCDRVKLEQVLVNLLTNACHAMENGGQVTIRVSNRKVDHDTAIVEAGDRSGIRQRVGDSVIVLEVRDSGCGIPADQISRVFDPFFTTKPTGKGTGLGLSVARKIVDLHGGQLELRNADGGGVAATLVLPCNPKMK
jgi:PAS domain S-box-containing protein